MSTCARCGATFSCAMAAADQTSVQPCWCTYLPPSVPVPTSADTPGCWCPACLAAHIASLAMPNAPVS